MSKYIRTYVKDFSELTARQTVHAREQLGEDATETSWVDDPTDPNGCLPLCDFLRMRSKFWDGICSMSYFSAYFIKIGRDGCTVTVAYKHW